MRANGSVSSWDQTTGRELVLLFALWSISHNQNIYIYTGMWHNPQTLSPFIKGFVDIFWLWLIDHKVNNKSSLATFLSPFIWITRTLWKLELLIDLKYFKFSGHQLRNKTNRNLIRARWWAINLASVSPRNQTGLLLLLLYSLLSFISAASEHHLVGCRGRDTVSQIIVRIIVFVYYLQKWLYLKVLKNSHRPE